jgi:Na+/alanine symporter
MRILVGIEHQSMELSLSILARIVVIPSPHQTEKFQSSLVVHMNFIYTILAALTILKQFFPVASSKANCIT